MNKDRHIISELNGFFAKSDNTKAIQGIMNVMDHINIDQRQMEFAKAANCKFTAAQVLKLMVLFPFFTIKNGCNYVGSTLGHLFACKRDMFYRFLANERINWRQVVYSFNRRLLGRIALRSDAVNSKDPRCLIVDDTDFPKAGRKGDWNALLSTNTVLGAFEAYKIYSMRWSIEVSFSEAKRLLNLGKCQCRDFASQIASVSLCMLQYNILGCVKRYESYETIGGLFREVTKSSVELTVTEKIWGIIMEVLQTLAEAFSFDQDEMMRAIINNNNNELIAVRRAMLALQRAA